MRQMDLFTAEIEPLDLPKRGEGRLPFDEFHDRNPHVYRELRLLALHYVRQGRKRLSIKGLYEILRLRFVHTEGGGSFALNNNYTANYSRLLMENNLELAGVFATRIRHALTKE
jgi:hypothetical protein